MISTTLPQHVFSNVLPLLNRSLCAPAFAGLAALRDYLALRVTVVWASGAAVVLVGLPVKTRSTG